MNKIPKKPPVTGWFPKTLTNLSILLEVTVKHQKSIFQLVDCSPGLVLLPKLQVH